MKYESILTISYLFINNNTLLKGHLGVLTVWRQSDASENLSINIILTRQ